MNPKGEQLILIIFFGLLLFAAFAVPDELSFGLTIFVYSVIATVVFLAVVVMGVGVAFSGEKFFVALKAYEKWKAKRYEIVTAPAGHQVYIVGTAPGVLQLSGGNQYFQQQQPIIQESNEPPMLSDGNWIDKFLFKQDGRFAQPHLMINGITGSGKTTLAQHILTKLCVDDYELYLIDPKYMPASPSWSFEPFVDKIENVLEGLSQIEGIIRSRKDADINSLVPVYCVLDEYDWCYSVYNRQFTNIVRQIFKVGRQLKVHLIASGQSALATDTGLSGSDRRNFGTVILGNEAIAFTKNTQMYNSNRGELQSKLEWYKNTVPRYALVLPVDDAPSVEVVPTIHNDFSGLVSSVPNVSIEFSDKDKEIWNLKQEGFSDSRIAKDVFGYDGGNQINKVKDTVNRMSQYRNGS